MNMLKWWKHNAGDEARAQCRVCFRALMHRLLAYARIQVDEETDVEMLLSGVMQRVADAAAQGRVPATEQDLLPYSMRAIWHDAQRLRQRNRNRRQAEKQFMAESVPPAENHPRLEQLEAAQRSAQLRDALRTLSPELAEPVLLHIWEDLGFTEISRRLALPESTIRSRYLVALRTMKKHLSTIEIG